MTQIEKFRSYLKKENLDAAIISSEINQRYLSDFSYSDGYIVIGQDKAFLLADFRYIEAARNEVSELDVIMPKGSMLGALKDIVSNEGYTEIAIEETAVCCDTFERLKEALPASCNLRFGASKALDAQRSVKLPYEIERISKAQEITDAAFSHILSFISPKRTEKEIALELEFFMRSHGAEGIAFDTIAVSGSSSALPHGVPADRPLQNGFLTMDFGAKYNGYCSDMTRTVVIGKATDEMKQVYGTVLQAQLNALDNLKADMLCKDADEFARSVIRDAGYGDAFGHSLGHGVGMYVHESPRLSQNAKSDELLRVGTVVTVEPGIYLEGKFGCRIEDMVYVSENKKINNLTKSPKNLIEI